MIIEYQTGQVLNGVAALIFLSIHLSICLSICLSIYLSVRQLYTTWTASGVYNVMCGPAGLEVSEEK